MTITSEQLRDIGERIANDMRDQLVDGPEFTKRAFAEFQKLQVKQEPVAYRYKIIGTSWTYKDSEPSREFAGSEWGKWQVTPLYAAPPDLAADKRDAERYRWLRDKCPDFERYASPWQYDELDASIDAAIGEKK